MSENITVEIVEPSNRCDCNHEKGEFGPLCPNAPKPPPKPPKPPKCVFIVPYRDREEHYKFFSNQMKIILEDYSPEDYKIYYIHQCDARNFNRGAMKNIGFLMLKHKYPNDYKNITIVFNDVDTIPIRKNLIDYNTRPGVVKHHYGFTYTLGGIFSIKGSDFEKVNGFPNFWAWGYEDNLINQRVTQANITIDRSEFYGIGDKNIIRLNDGNLRQVNRDEFNRYMQLTREGFPNIYNLEYEIDETSGFVNVFHFTTNHAANSQANSIHNLIDGSVPFKTTFGMMGANRRSKNTKMPMNMRQ
jgi:hypothetical protein